MTDEEFRALYDAHARSLWAYAYRMCGESSTADDVVQESFYRALSAAALRKTTEEHRRRYLFKVATNLLRRESRRPPNPLNHEDIPAREDDAFQRLDVEHALSRLTDVERQTLWLSHVEGLTYREIARLLGYREGSMRQVAVRARRRFLRAFGSDSE